MRICDYMKAEWICTDLKGENKFEIIENLFTYLAERAEIAKDKNKILEAIFTREKLMSTAIGKGVAIPHAKCGLCNDFYFTVGIIRDGLVYDGSSEEKIYIIGLFFGPEDKPNMHIKLLSGIAKLLNRKKFRDELLSCNDKRRIYDLFDEYDK